MNEARGGGGGGPRPAKVFPFTCVHVGHVNDGFDPNAATSTRARGAGRRRMGLGKRRSPSLDVLVLRMPHPELDRMDVGQGGLVGSGVLVVRARARDPNGYVVTVIRHWLVVGGSHFRRISEGIETRLIVRGARNRLLRVRRRHNRRHGARRILRQLPAAVVPLVVLGIAEVTHERSGSEKKREDSNASTNIDS